LSRRTLVLSICLSLLLVGVSAAKERRARPSKKDSATVTAQAWRGGEYSWVRLVSVDGQPLDEEPGPRPLAGTNDEVRVPNGVAAARVVPGRHEIVVRFAPVTVRRLDGPRQVLPASLDAPTKLHSITFDAQAGRTYVVRSRAWVRPDPDVPFGTYPPEILRVHLAVVPVAARCDVVWVVERKSGERVACSTYPDGCMSCDGVVPAP
jgi:hypothetical protein